MQLIRSVHVCTYLNFRNTILIWQPFQKSYLILPFGFDNSYFSNWQMTNFLYINNNKVYVVTVVASYSYRYRSITHTSLTLVLQTCGQSKTFGNILSILVRISAHLNLVVSLQVNCRFVGMLKLFSWRICSVNGELLTLVNVVRSVWINEN